MAGEAKSPNAPMAVFVFSLVYVGFSLLTELPILWSRPIPLAAAQQSAVRTGQIIGVLIECAVIAALGFAVLNKRVWAAWWLVVLAVAELILVLARRDFVNALLPLILGSLSFWAANSLRGRRGAISAENS
jgi:hypothetical protein